MQKFTVSRDDSICDAWHDVAKTKSDKLVCVFTECVHHLDRADSRLCIVKSSDRGRRLLQGDLALTHSARSRRLESRKRLDKRHFF